MMRRFFIVLIVWGTLLAWSGIAWTPFSSIDLKMDLTLTKNAQALEHGWDIRVIPQHPASMTVLDRGQPAFLTIPLLSPGAYRLRLKLKFHAPDQAVDLILNDVPLTTLRPTVLGHTERFSIHVPVGVIHAGRNRLVFLHHGVSGKTEYEQVRLTNYYAAISTVHGVYLTFSPTVGGSQRLGRAVAMVIQGIGVGGFRALMPFGMLVTMGALLIGLSGLAPYQLVFPGASLWTATLLGLGLYRLWVPYQVRENLWRWLRQFHATGWIRSGLGRLGRAKVPLLLSAIVVYGILLRANDYQTKRYEQWLYLGTTTDAVLIFDTAARVLGTGTFAQFDGTYARVTGLAGYALGLVAMAAGGLYPGYQWLRAWLVLIGALVPVVGFAIVRLALGSALAGLSTAILLASEPILVTESKTIYHDVPATLCLGLSLYWLYRVLREDRFRPGLAITLGITSGLTILAKMSHGCLLLVIAGAALLRRWTLPRWKNVGLALVAIAVVLSLWMGRNARLLGAPILSSQSGLIFACSTGQAVWKPPGAGGEIATVGQEQRFNQAYAQQALAWITAHPSTYARMVARKIRTFWLEGPSPWQQTLLWGMVAALGVLLVWQRGLIRAMLPIWSYLVFYSATFGFTWPALSTYYPPFLFLLVIATAPLAVVTLDPVWHWVCTVARSRGVRQSWVDVGALCFCLGVGLPFLSAPWDALRRHDREIEAERAYLAWVGTVLPEDAVVIQTNQGNPWDVQRYTQRPVVFNILNGIPWFVYTTPYGVREYRRDWASINYNPTSFRLDIPRDHGRVDAALCLTPLEREISSNQGVRGLITIWRQRGRQLFVLDTDAEILVRNFLPSNAYVLRGDEVTLKLYQVCPYDRRRAVYRLLERDDPRLVDFGPRAEEVVSWQTAPCPRAQPTTVWFMGASGEHPGLARLMVNGIQAMTFPFGPAGSAQWSENGYRLEYQQLRPARLTHDDPTYSLGLFALTVPVEIVEAGHPLTLSVSPLLVTNDPQSWFGLVETSNVTPREFDGPLGQSIEGVGAVLRASWVFRDVPDPRGQSTTIWASRAQAGPSEP